MFYKLSIQYWIKHKSRLFCLIAVLLFASAALTCSHFLVRSLKQYQIDEVYRTKGDYDLIASEIPVDSFQKLKDIDNDFDVGCYYELGWASDENSISKYKTICFEDPLSEDIYHTDLTEGRMPSSPDEIAIRSDFLKSLGLYPHPGVSVKLFFNSIEDTELFSEEFTVTGVFETNEMNREYYANDPAGNLPGVIVDRSIADRFNYETITAFIREETIPTSELINKVQGILGNVPLALNYRSGQLTYFLGIDMNYLQDSGLDMQSTDMIYSEAVSKNLVSKDFYSSVLIPLSSFLICITAILSISGLLKNIISERKQTYATLRCIGLKASSCSIYLLIEMEVITVLSSLAGISLGICIFKLLINIVNHFINFGLSSSIHFSKLVNAVTFDPISFTLLLCIISTGTSLIIPIRKINKMSPSEMLSEEDSLFTRFKLKNGLKSCFKGGLIGTVNRRVNLCDPTAFFILSVIISAMMFGFVYFRALSDKASSEFKYEAESNHLDKYDYSANKIMSISDNGSGFSNHHHNGISSGFISTLTKSGYTEKVISSIRNTSTRLTFNKPVTEELSDLLGPDKYGDYVDPNPEVDKMLKAAHIAADKKTGYSENEKQYIVNSIGLPAEQLNELTNNVRAGRIDISKLSSGEEVILCVPEEYVDTCIKYFPLGSNLPLSDILLSEEEENILADSAEMFDKKYRVYDEIYTDKDGREFYIFDCSFGKRLDIKAKVAAVIVLDDELYEMYFNNDALSYRPESNLTIICLDTEFRTWGAADENYTNIKVKLKEDVNIREFDKYWYKLMAECKGVKTTSVYDIEQKISAETSRTMITFYLLTALLIILGMISVVISMYTKLNMKYNTIRTLRNSGLPLSGILKIIVSQNYYLPVFSVVIGNLPILACQLYFNYLRHLVDTSGQGIINVESESQIPLHFYMPYRYDLFSYSYPLLLAICLVISTVILSIGIIPQYIYLRNNKFLGSEGD